MTLVEIMITMLISSVIAASTFVFFAGQQRIYETQTKLLNIQQNVWAAMEVLTRYTRAAGSGMFECLRPASYANTGGAGGGRLPSSSPSPGPLSTSLATTPGAGIRAYNAATGSSQWIPPLWIVDNSNADANVVTNTDILTVAFGTQTSGTDTDAELGQNFLDTSAANPITLKLANGSNMFRAGEFVLLLVTPSWGYGNDPKIDRGCTMLQITDYAANTTTLHHSSVAIDGMTWNPPDPQAGMLPATTNYGVGNAGVRNFGMLAWLRFFVRQDPVTGIPNLMLQQLHRGGADGQPQVLAEGIEDLQVSFACDTGTLTDHTLAKINGQLDEGVDDAAKIDDEWWNNVPNDKLPSITDQGYCNLPTAIRLTVVARSLSPDDLVDPTVTGNGPMDVENHRYSTPRPTDHFRRRVLSTTVYPRNNKPL
jgi:type II secretory pathway pseudopilin PulG